MKCKTCGLDKKEQVRVIDKVISEIKEMKDKTLKLKEQVKALEYIDSEKWRDSTQTFTYKKKERK